jgi:hypothetical protein
VHWCVSACACVRAATRACVCAANDGVLRRESALRRAPSLLVGKAVPSWHSHEIPDSRGPSFGPRLLVTSNRSGLERSREREPPGADSEPARGLCAGDRDQSPRPGRSLARGSPHQPSGNPDGTRSRGLVDQGAALAAASASSAPRAGGTERLRRGSPRIFNVACPARATPEAGPGLRAQRPLGASGAASGWWQWW